jgi:hypothetical protein
VFLVPPILIEQGLFEADLSSRCFNDQLTGLTDSSILSAFELQTNPRWIGACGDRKVVFQMIRVAMKGEIDAAIKRRVDNVSVPRNPLPP